MWAIAFLLLCSTAALDAGPDCERACSVARSAGYGCEVHNVKFFDNKQAVGETNLAVFHLTRRGDKATTEAHKAAYGGC